MKYLLGETRRVAGLTLESGETLPPGVYTSPEMYEWEVERIFKREWLCVARVDEVPATGDYLSVEVIGRSIVITRDENGALHALSRVCRHRFMDVLPPETTPPRGNLSRLTCPYHGWTYRLDGRYVGQLAGAPLMQGVDFDRSTCRLPTFPIAEWNGFLWINLDPDAEPLAPHLQGLTDKLGSYDFSSWITVDTMVWKSVAANWKVALENGAESYHHIGAHAATLQLLMPGQNTRVDDATGRWFTMLNPVSKQAAAGEDNGHPVLPTLLPPWPGLTPEQRSGMIVAGIFPQFLLAMTPDNAVWIRWLPTGPTTHDTQISILMAPESREAAGFEEARTVYRSLVSQVQAEDMVVMQGVQRGLAEAPSGRGRFSLLERPLWQFQRYLALMLMPSEASTQQCKQSGAARSESG
ncbi:aromatic ring-hydroxylating dioxygenase subunit alpha [Nonomuraea zeae]|uniref:Aromatic ring-hydroxylating dioxygenase subunit alpha n=1 Tax=Nonomuraea zeae TaxID=1642303 RepID=A0A5S4G5J2_9ACTN|nr:aromatic ring-hydroxylating dioxygenase subunit alpha [Nonomuraea zeae]